MPETSEELKPECWVSQRALDDLHREGGHVGTKTIIWNTPDSKTAKPRVALYARRAHPAPTAADTPKPLRLCAYCESWNSKPCGDGCHWSPTDPTPDQLEPTVPAAADTPKPAKTAYDILGDPRIGVSAPTAADTGLVERLHSAGQDTLYWKTEAQKLNKERQAINAAREAAEQREAAAREQIAELERVLRDLMAALGTGPFPRLLLDRIDAALTLAAKEPRHD